MSGLCCCFHGRRRETRWLLHTGASVASVTTAVFGYFNCHHTWKHITPVMRFWRWKTPCNNACGCRWHVSDNVWAEAYFLFNTGMPTLAPTEPPFELNNERNKPSWRPGFEVLLKSLRFSPCGPLSAAPNKRGFVRSATEALVKLVGQALLCWILGGFNPEHFTSHLTLPGTQTVIYLRYHMLLFRNAKP